MGDAPGEQAERLELSGLVQLGLHAAQLGYALLDLDRQSPRVACLVDVPVHGQTHQCAGEEHQPPEPGPGPHRTDDVNLGRARGLAPAPDVALCRSSHVEAVAPRREVRVRRFLVERRVALRPPDLVPLEPALKTHAMLAGERDRPERESQVIADGG